MVRRLRVRLEEAKLALAAGSLEPPAMDWLPEHEERLSVLKRTVFEKNPVALRWHLQMARKEYGDALAARLLQALQVTDHSGWVAGALLNL